MRSHTIGGQRLLAVGSGALLMLVILLTLFPRAASAQRDVIGRGMPLGLGVVQPIRNCSGLAATDLTAIAGAGSHVVSAVETTSRGTAVCTIEGILAPAIGFRVELPLTTWTQRYLQTGCGGLCGSLNIRTGAADGCPLVANGEFATASTDMGHRGAGGDFGRDPQKRADFAYRGVHLTAVAAKALIRAFYGRAERFSYFEGCSDGGREALVEAQRFPQDFIGIIAGAPAMNFQVQNSFYHSWQAVSNTGPDGKAVLIASRLPILHAAVLKACDGLDGLVDGLVSAPGSCHFDPGAAECKPGGSPNECLTSAEVIAARRLYTGPRDPSTGERLTQGQPLYGSELQWAGVFVPQAAGQPIFSGRIAVEAMPNLIFPHDGPTRLEDLVFTSANFARLRERHALFDATNPDISAFVSRGGKLILFHGMNDPHISPINTIAYYEAVRRLLGNARANATERLYLLPGMGHCSGGDGPSLFDLVSPLLAWVERGVAPDAILTRQAPPNLRTAFGLPIASGPERDDGAGKSMTPPSQTQAVTNSVKESRSRPVFPYPFIAAYTGTGDKDVAKNWKRGQSMPIPVPTWAGSDFFAPYRGQVDRPLAQKGSIRLRLAR